MSSGEKLQKHEIEELAAVWERLVNTLFSNEVKIDKKESLFKYFKFGYTDTGDLRNLTTNEAREFIINVKKILN